MLGSSEGTRLENVPHKRKYRIIHFSGRMHNWTVWHRNDHKHWEAAWFAYTEEEAQRYVLLDSVHLSQV